MIVLTIGPKIMSGMCLHSLTPIVGSLTKYFLKYSSGVLLLFQVNARHLYTANDNIASRDHDTCIDSGISFLRL